MSGGHARELFQDLCSGLGTALESMLGQAPEISVDPLPAAPDETTLRWRQPMGSLPGAVWVVAGEADWKSMGRAVLLAAGIEDSDDAELKSTYFEVVNQALAGFGQALTARLRREVTPNGGAVAEAEAREAAHWAEFDVKTGELSFTVAAGFENDFLEGINSVLAPAELPAPAASSPETKTPVEASSHTFDLLLEVELPVSVSFGRAQLPLKDVLKLTTGSIVELNRGIVEPVEIIVNNCVIARGEVVVVEGNFGVRIQEVVSRQERLRTLQ